MWRRGAGSLVLMIKGVFGKGNARCRRSQGSGVLDANRRIDVILSFVAGGKCLEIEICQYFFDCRSKN